MYYFPTQGALRWQLGQWIQQYDSLLGLTTIKKDTVLVNNVKSCPKQQGTIEFMWPLGW